jgi:hypothetical protein
MVLGGLQIVAGVALTLIGVPNFGAALISEGISDMFMGVMCAISG